MSEHYTVGVPRRNKNSPNPNISRSDMRSPSSSPVPPASKEESFRGGGDVRTKVFSYSSRASKSATSSLSQRIDSLLSFNDTHFKSQAFESVLKKGQELCLAIKEEKNDKIMLGKISLCEMIKAFEDLVDISMGQNEKLRNLESLVLELQSGIDSQKDQIADLQNQLKTMKLRAVTADYVSYFVVQIINDYENDAVDSDSIYDALKRKLKFEKLSLRREKPNLKGNDYWEALYAMESHKIFGKYIVKAGFTYEEFDLMYTFCGKRNDHFHSNYDRLNSDARIQQINDCLVSLISTDLDSELVPYKTVVIKAIERIRDSKVEKFVESR